MENSIPQPFLDYLATIPGLDADALGKALESHPGTGIRVNRRKLTPQQGESLYPDAQRIDWCESGFTLTERPVFTLNPLLHAGCFYVQDPSSMIYEQLISSLRAGINKDSVTLLDFCAAPGGKTTAMINALKDTDVVVANEYVAARGKILRENLQKWGFSNIITTGDESGSYAALPSVFDIIAVDAPCSGEGMMRKEEIARSQWSHRLTEECALLQREILRDIAGILRPGGYLIYSTCTFNLKEDEENSLYIQNELGLNPVVIDRLGLKGISHVRRGLVDGVEALRFMPHITPQGEGIYLSIFQKPEAEYGETESLNIDGCTTSPQKTGKKEKGNKKRGGETQTLPKEDKEWLSSLIKPGKDIGFEINDNYVNAVPTNIIPLRSLLADKKIRITSSGIPAGEMKGKNFIPDSRLVLADFYSRDALKSIEVDEAGALSYLRRESFALDPNISKGYVVINYKGHPLGLMKNLGNRANNLFPSPWRIRIQ